MAEPFLSLNLSDFERRAEELDASISQVPFALANAMTTAAFKTRELLIHDTWPQHVVARNRSFLNAALHVLPARKHDLEVHIIDQLGRGQLMLHATGGARTARAGGRLAIPPKGSVRRGPHGIDPSQLPKALVQSTPKRALRVTQRGIFVGQGGRLHLKYSFHTQANVNNDVPFFEDFNRYMLAELETAFPRALERAMRTAY